MASHDGMPPSMAGHGPPYPPMVWPLGLFQKNRARGHKFLPNLVIFFFCMERILTSILRISSVCQPRDVKLAIAAQIFVAAGVLVLFIINIIFAMRLVRSTHRNFGWHPAFSIGFKIICVLIGGTLIAVIAGTVQSFYTLNPSTRATDRGLQLYGSTFLAIIATLPLPITLLALLIPYSPLDRFGIGRLRTKVFVLLISTTLLSLGAWYRCGVAWQTPVPRTQPLPSYLGKGAFYVFNFFVEVQTVLMYAILRVDLRWHIPNGAKGPGSYSVVQIQLDIEMQDSRTSSGTKHDDTFSLNEEKELDIDIEKTPPPTPPKHIEQIVNSQRSSLAVPKPAADGSKSQRSSILSNRLSFLTKSSSMLAIPEQKRSWRKSDQERIVKRLGGPWQQLASPTASVFSFEKSPTMSTFSQEKTAACSVIESQDAPAHNRSASEAPSIPDVVNQGGWTSKIDWEFRSPARFLSLSRKSMIGLQIQK
ncbi:hypothetical protein EJ02DRAFT_374560 [Clathrospora elynae]|uniref:Uncharacterized protein n=1 Tax=Clathrospora elynae TaxID=706981 RepID=A0A6A5T1P2_9PLEO|nr:hypothetical protein EJ02DRAFT_374560 [Clathrospora elynae]